jgi:hypothetical protein
MNVPTFPHNIDIAAFLSRCDDIYYGQSTKELRAVLKRKGFDNLEIEIMEEKIQTAFYGHAIPWETYSGFLQAGIPEETIKFVFDGKKDRKYNYFNTKDFVKWLKYVHKSNYIEWLKKRDVNFINYNSYYLHMAKIVDMFIYLRMNKNPQRFNLDDTCLCILSRFIDQPDRCALQDSILMTKLIKSLDLLNKYYRIVNSLTIWPEVMDWVQFNTGCTLQMMFVLTCPKMLKYSYIIKPKEMISIAEKLVGLDIKEMDSVIDSLVQLVL